MEALITNGSVKKTVISCIQGPRLKGISLTQFIEFKQLRNVYEKQLKEKARLLKEVTISTSYRASIEDDNYKSLLQLDG